MNRKSIRIAMAVLFTICLAVSAFAQGLHVESTKSGGPLGDGTEEMWAMPKMMKMLNNKTGEVVIVRLDKELFITTDPADKTYSEMTFTEMEGAMKKATGKMDARMAEMQKKLAEMPEEQRKMVEKMMGDKMPGAKDAKIDVQKTEDMKKISGYGCTKYVITKDGNDFMTIWATKDVNGFDAMKKDWEEFSKRMMAMSPMAGKGIGEAFSKIDGFPIQTDMGHGMTSTVTKVEKKTTAASEFEVPSGYKKVKPKVMEDMNKMDTED